MVGRKSTGRCRFRRPAASSGGKEPLPMKYMILIYGEEKGWETQSQAAREEVMAAFLKYVGELTQAGAMLGGDPLKPVSTATTIRVRGGKVQTTDGPFAETKEQLGGYFLIEAKDLDEAIRWGAKCPGALYGSVEVRPILPMGPMG